MEALYYVIGLIIGIVLIAVAIPWIREKITDERFKNITTYLKLLMASVEEAHPEFAGKEKSSWVIEQMVQKFPGLNASYVQMLINGFMAALTVEGILNRKKSA